MSTLQRIVITSPLTANGFKSVCDLAPGGRTAMTNLCNYVESIPDQQPASLAIKVAAVQASGTLTVATGGSSNGQTCTICNVTFTAETSGATGNQFNISATAATQAANMAAAINASSSLTGIVTATSALGVVTITSVVPGLVGNGLQLSAGNLSNVTLGAMASGTDGTAYSIDLS